jgi:hypothetical protein
MLQLLIAVLALALCAGGSFAAPTVWDGTANIDWYTEDASSTSFTITTAEELAGLASLVNDGTSFSGKIITLNSDILLNDTTGCGENGFVSTETSHKWIPIGTPSYPFMGEFTGAKATGSHKIFGLYISDGDSYQGLFGYTSEAQISEIDLACGVVTGKNYTGALVGYAAGGSIIKGASGIVVQGEHCVGGLVGHTTGTVSQSYATGNVTATGNYVGGLVGSTRNSVSGSLVDGTYTTYSLGSVKGDNYVGGLIGYASAISSYAILIDSVYSEGAVEATGSCVGGVVGYMNGYSSSNFSQLKNLYSKGSVTAKGDYVGGLVGGTNYATVSDAYSEGNVSTDGEFVGGLIGRTECSVSGSLVDGAYTTYSLGSVKGGTYVGGLVGFVYIDSPYAILIDSVYSEGSVEATGTHVGGVVGHMKGYSSSYPSQLKNLYSKGSVTAVGPYVGGLVGYAYHATVSDAYSDGDVSATGDYVGGLVGSTVSSVSGSIVNGAYTTYSLGSVKGGSYVGGLVGYVLNVSFDTLSIDSAYSEGSVEATGRAVGGVVGYAKGDREFVTSVSSYDYYSDRYPVYIQQVYSIGNIQAAGNAVGGVLGQGLFAPVWDAYSEGDVTGQDSVGGLVGQTTSSIGGSNRAAGSFTTYSKGDVSGGSFVGGIVG